MNNRKHDNWCKRIADELEKYNSGNWFAYDGDIYPMDSDDFNALGEGFRFVDDDPDTFNEYYLFPCGDKVDIDDTEPLSLYDWFTDDTIYNLEYVLDSNKELTAVRVMVACGGPNIYINTWDKQVELFWWTESGKYYLPADLCDSITSVIDELFYSN